MCARVPDGPRTRLSLIARLEVWSDDASWQEFNDLYGQLLRNFVIRRGVPEDDADDVVQDTRVSVAKALRAGRWNPEKSSFRQWLLRVTKNRVFDYFRRNARRRREVRHASRTSTRRTATVERLPDSKIPKPEEIWEEEWRKNIMKLALERVKARVKPAHFQIFHQHIMKEQSPAKVAKAFGVSQAQVHLIKHRLKKAIKEAATELQRELEAGHERNGSHRGRRSDARGAKRKPTTNDE